MSTVYVDVDTQLDFIYPTGALYAPGAERIHANLGRLTANAVRHGFPILSTMDSHEERDREFARYSFRPHCIAGTIGQHKLACTIASRSQHFIQKQVFDCFSNPRMEKLLADWKPERVVVYGVVTDVCVNYAINGLLERNYRVTVVTDAVCALNADAADQCEGHWLQAGVKLVTTASLCG